MIMKTLKLKRFLSSALLVLSVIAVQARGTGTFSVKKDRLYDANGKSFIVAGMNNPHAWFTEKAYTALDDIKATGANTVRIVWQTRGGSLETLEQAIKRSIELSMVPIVELHDVTGSPSGDALVRMAEWYASEQVKKCLSGYERYIMLNIANEWGDNRTTSEYWLESYTRAVKVMREAGYRTTLVVDAPGWGQNITPFLEKGSELMEADPLHNILFSVHMYGSWNNPDDIVNKLTAAKKQKLPLIVGEFGYNYNDGGNNLTCKADHRTILDTCHKLGYGFIPWSWTGNNRENQWLDIVENTDWKTLTWWGNEVVNGRYGIRETGKPCRIFSKSK